MRRQIFLLACFPAYWRERGKRNHIAGPEPGNLPIRPVSDPVQPSCCPYRPNTFSTHLSGNGSVRAFPPGKKLKIGTTKTHRLECCRGRGACNAGQGATASRLLGTAIPDSAQSRRRHFGSFPLISTAMQYGLLGKGLGRNRAWQDSCSRAQPTPPPPPNQQDANGIYPIGRPTKLRGKYQQSSVHRSGRLCSAGCISGPCLLACLLAGWHANYYPQLALRQLQH